MEQPRTFHDHRRGKAMGMPYEIPTPRLTARENQFLQLLADGYSYAEIQQTMGIANRTCKAHSQHLRYRLGANSMPHAIAIAFRMGLLD